MSRPTSKPAFRPSNIESEPTSKLGHGNRPSDNTDRVGLGGPRSALAGLVGDYLRSNGLRQIDFCRQNGFDQGLLSKILSSVVNTLNVETALKLAEGMNLPPAVVFEAIGKTDVHEMLVRFYSGGGMRG